MKKLIYILLSIELFIISILSLNILKENDLNKIIFKNSVSISVNINDITKFIPSYEKWIENLAKENKVIISKYSFTDDNNLVIFTTDMSLGNRIKLKENILQNTQKNNFIANYDSTDKNQIYKFSTLQSDVKITIKSIYDVEQIGLDGIYNLIGDRNSIEKTINSMNNDYITANIYNDYYNIGLYLSPTIIKNIILILICFIITIIQYIISKSKELSILKIMGYSTIDIILRINKEFLNILLTSSLVSYTGFIIYTYDKFNYIYSFYFICTIILCLVIKILTISLMLFIYLTNSKAISLIKGKKTYSTISVMNYILKFTFMVFTFLSLATCISNLDKLSIQKSNLSEWENTKNIYQVTLNDTGVDHLSKEEVDLYNNIYNLYSNLNKKNNLFIIDSSNFEKNFDGEYLYKINSPNSNSKISQYGENITINQNYLNFNPIYSEKKDVKNKIINNDNTLNLLVPKNLLKYENEIKHNFLELFFFQKIRVNNIYNEKLKLDLNDTKKSELNINIIYVDNNQSYFTFDSTIEKQNKNRIYDPIAIVYTGNFDNSYAMSYISSCSYLYSENIDIFEDIQLIAKNCNVESSFRGLVPIYNEYGLHINNLEQQIEKETFTILILFLSNIMIIYFIIISYYEKNKYKIYIKKLFGYMFFERNKLFFLLLAIINTIPVLFSINIFPILMNLFGEEYNIKINNIIIIFAIIVFIFEIIFTFFLDQFLLKKNFNKIIKGEH